ncbi:unnamed protein product, partial [Effrenium voratum]
TCGLCWRVTAARGCRVPFACAPFCERRVDWVAFLQAAVERAPLEVPARLLSSRPALAEFPNFLSRQEVRTLESVARASGFQQEEELPQDTRDVFKVDCESRKCLLHPLVQEVYRRIAELLGIPPANFESMEFLLYQKGQHYEAHMDDGGEWWEMPALSAGRGVPAALVLTDRLAY